MYQQIDIDFSEYSFPHLWNHMHHVSLKNRLLFIDTWDSRRKLYGTSQSKHRRSAHTHMPPNFLNRYTESSNSPDQSYPQTHAQDSDPQR